ncbi:MAG: polysaccharide deacetylase family protein [bacterium]
MIRSRFAIATVLCLSLTLAATAGQVAVTIDDLPFLRGGRNLSAAEESVCFRQVLAALDKHQIEATFFVNGSRLQKRHEVLLDELIAAGHTVGNHTWSHLNLNKTDTTSYFEDINRGQESIARWVGEVHYFRYPFLFRGADTTKHDVVTRYLEDEGYVVVPVTIDNDDWRFNKDYAAAMNEGDTASALKIGAEYLSHMQRRTEYFDSVSVADLGRSVKHILLLHMTELNSIYLDSLLSWYENSGWEFITAQQALTDPVYALPNKYIGPWGISWLFRLEHPDWIKTE